MYKNTDNQQTGVSHKSSPTPNPHLPTPRTAFLYSDDLLKYRFEGKHPLNQERLRMTYELLDGYGVFDLPNVKLIEPKPASREDVLLAHDEEYVDRVERISRGEVVYDAFLYGFRWPDNPPFPGMYEASLLYTGASVQAAEMVMSGEADIAFSISSGLHHAKRRSASGFCIFNDPAVAIRHMLRKWDQVVYVDLDAHHGDGVQEAFYDTSKVLTCSIHESGRFIFPGTGFVNEIGTGEGEGFSLNAPLAPYSDDSALYRVLEEAVMPAIRTYNPQALFLQLGADGHFEDPLTQLNYTSRGWLRAAKMLLDLNIPTVATGGGGYNLYTVCRLWALAFAEMIGVDLPDETPDPFFEKHHIRLLHDIFTPEVPASDMRTVSKTAKETIQGIRALVWPKHRLLSG